LQTALKGSKNRCACAGDLKRCSTRSRLRTSGWEFSLSWVQKTAKVFDSFDEIEALHEAQSITDDPPSIRRAALKQAREYAPIVRQKDPLEVPFTIVSWPAVSGVHYGRARPAAATCSC
jgi:hypothetical protein